MSSTYQIKELDTLLGKYIGSSKQIVDARVIRLTGPGENYGSVMLKVDITLKNKSDATKEKLYAVAKIIPEDEFFKELFNIQVSCKVEIAFYDTIVPTLQQFQRERGVGEVVDFFPKMYGGRINLDGSDTVDENALLVLENLKEEGYTNVDRMKSFDLPTTKLILKDLAAFHAVPLAVKLSEPELFESKIKVYLKELPPPPKEESEDKKHLIAMNDLMDFLETYNDCKYAIPKLRRNREKMGERAKCERHEPFVTMVHGDLWVNNIMTKFEDGQSIKNKFVDFQFPKYESPAMDLFFFLWTSVQMNILKEYLDELIQFYHDNFIQCLQQLSCDISLFSMDRLQDELKSVSKVEIFHTLFMIAVIIFYKKDDGELFQHPLSRKIEDIPDVAKERMVYMIKICDEKGWLQD